MAITKTYNLTANNGAVYADTAAWIAAHGLSGTQAGEYLVEDDEGMNHGKISLLDGGTGVQVVLEYTDQATADSHEASFAADLASDVTVTRVSV